MAERASSARARAALSAWRPFVARDACATEVARLAEAIRRQREPGEWLETGPGSLAERIAGESESPLDGAGLVAVGRWLEAAEATRSAWSDDEARGRAPGLAAHVDLLAPPPGLARRLAAALDADGRVRDSASPELKRARAALGEGARKLEHQLQRWAQGFGSDAYVTRHAERFVVLVPAAGFPRRRGIVHDVSNSGQSLFVEPLEACAENNRLIELRAAADEEERRVLRALAADVQSAAPALLALEETLAHLDGLRARARWAVEFGGVALAPGGPRLALRDARHPLLAMGAERSFAGRDVVPLDLVLGDAADGGPGRLLLVSGPNMGGKTVLLKTVGLAVACARSAFPFTMGEGGVVPWIETLVVDLGDEQSVERGLSTFAAHLRTLAQMAAAASPETLVLCDELGAGTDPDEGGALARALIEHVAARGSWGVVTTHLGSLKRLGGDVAGVVNGSLAFDEPTLTPLYRFLPGVPGASHALSVAERLGFPEALLERARTLTPESARALERLTAELATATGEVRAEREALARAREQAEAAAADHREAAEAARRELSERRRAVVREGEALVGRARELWQEAQREARRRDKTREGAERLRAAMGEIERDLERVAAESGEPVKTPLPAAELLPGRKVRVVDLGVTAEIVSGPDAEGRVALRRGNWSIQSRADRLAATTEPEVAPERAVAGTWSAPEAAPLEVDLRGMEVAEALGTLDGGLDQAVRAGLAELRVVHGIGRGVLRAAVEKHLRGHPQVASQRMGGVGEGGRGVTVARLR